MASCFIKSPKLIRLMPVFPSGAGLKNRASGETQGPKTVRRARLVCGKTKRRNGVAADADPPCETHRLWPPRGAKRPWIEPRPVQTAAKPKERTACREKPTHLLKRDGIHGQCREAHKEVHASKNLRRRRNRVQFQPSRQKQKPAPDEAAIFDMAAPITHFGAKPAALRPLAGLVFRP